MNLSEASRRILATLFETRTGQQLALSRRWRIDTALASIMRDRGFETIDQLVARMVSGADPSLAATVIEALLKIRREVVFHIASEEVLKKRSYEPAPVFRHKASALQSHIVAILEHLTRE
jgi:uncharacterized protein (UPF0297 family)